MSFSWQTGDDVNTGGKFLSEPGTYHLAVTAVDENVTNKDGQLIDNAAFRIHVEVLDGTVAGQKEKTKDIIFFHPKPSQANGGAFARKRIDRLFLAANLMGMDAVGGKEVVFDLSKMVGQQIVAKFQMDDDNKYVELAFADIFHVDDLAVKDIPKDKAMMALIPSGCRWPSGKAPGADDAEKAAASQVQKPAVDVESLDI
jgi:hypothetical protein